MTSISHTLTLTLHKSLKIPVNFWKVRGKTELVADNNEMSSKEFISDESGSLWKELEKAMTSLKEAMAMLT